MIDNNLIVDFLEKHCSYMTINNKNGEFVGTFNIKNFPSMQEMCKQIDRIASLNFFKNE